jgi:hypothetical protein
VPLAGRRLTLDELLPHHGQLRNHVAQCPTLTAQWLARLTSIQRRNSRITRSSVCNSSKPTALSLSPIMELTSHGILSLLLAFNLAVLASSYNFCGAFLAATLLLIGLGVISCLHRHGAFAVSLASLAGVGNIYEIPLSGVASRRSDIRPSTSTLQDTPGEKHGRQFAHNAKCLLT